MIVKNEQDGIIPTLESIRPYNSRVFIYDTGSTDSTIETALRVGPPGRTFVGHGTFDNFSQARNDAQKWAREQGIGEWVLWLDANDEICGPAPELAGDLDAILTVQEWHFASQNVTKFLNYRLYKLTEETIWKGYVHEWIELPPHYRTGKAPPEFKIRQDRTRNCGSSTARWKLDVELLTRQTAEFPLEPRGFFYLGRAKKDTGDVEGARAAFKRRLEFNDSFLEERYWARYFMAEMARDPVEFVLAYSICGRAEALVAATRIFIDRQDWHAAFMVAYTACRLEVPGDSILFLFMEDYEYERWHLLGRCAYYVNQMDVGRDACERAIRARGRKIDSDNIKWYPTINSTS